MEVERRTIVKELRQKAVADLLKTNLPTSHKCAEHSQQLRSQGNEVYKRLGDTNYCIPHTEEAFKLYSDSIAFAPLKSDELAFAFANRSAVLVRMMKYKESILDIDRALKISKADNYTFNIKLLCRKIECLAIQGLHECHDIYKEVECLMSEIDNNSKQSLFEVAEKAKTAALNCKKRTSEPVVVSNEVSEQTKFFLQKQNENPFESISIKHSNKYGRYLIANRDFDPGEIIYVEKPYATVTCLNSSYLYCGQCMNISWSMIPCDYCNWCMFCCESCKKEAWEQYHDIECIVFTQLKIHYETVSDANLLIIRSIILCTRKFGNINQLREALQAIDNSKGKVYLMQFFIKNKVTTLQKCNNFRSVHQRFFEKWFIRRHRPRICLHLATN